MRPPGVKLGLFAILGTLSLSAVLGCATASWDGAGTGARSGGNGEGAGGEGAAGPGGDGAGASDALCGPLTDKLLAELTPCCAEYGGAHCIDSVPPEFQALVDVCPDGGYCVPDLFILDGGAVQPEKCLSIGDVDGRWISGCIPQVAANASLLPTDDAHPGEFCVPCVSPLDQTSTGVCEIGTTCGGDPGGGPGGDPGGGGATCDDPGSPIDPSIFEPCPSACGGRCVDKALLPDPNDPSVANLGECAPGSGQLCVPDEILASKGLGVPDTCDWYGLEGRCMSECLPQIGEQISQGFVVKSTCPDHHFCAPCFDPTTDKPTGACTLTCDAGPDPAKAHDLPPCCDGIGTCVPKPLAGDQADKLGQDACADGSGLVCAPNDLMPGSGYVPSDCQPEFNFLDLADPDHAYGKCLPGCLPGLDSFFLNDTGQCGDPYKCAPCWQPGFLSDTETNAPGCEY